MSGITALRVAHALTTDKWLIFCLDSLRGCVSRDAQLSSISMLKELWLAVQHPVVGQHRWAKLSETSSTFASLHGC